MINPVVLWNFNQLTDKNLGLTNQPLDRKLQILPVEGDDRIDQQIFDDAARRRVAPRADPRLPYILERRLASHPGRNAGTRCSTSRLKQYVVGARQWRIVPVFVVGVED
jgi:hypothetical protein